MYASFGNAAYRPAFASVDRRYKAEKGEQIADRLN